MNKTSDSSWESVGDWYDRLVNAQGHYYHEHVILPKILKWIQNEKKSESALLDLACGQGILARHLPQKMPYVGIDASASLIRAAEKYEGKSTVHQFLTSDVTQPLPLEKKNFSHATIILALQNIATPLPVLKNASAHLQKKGQLVIVLNHPCFRIPRQSSWQIDPTKKLQFRRIDRYFSPMEIPIQMHPSKQGTSAQTWSFHHPLSAYSAWLKEAGFTIELIEEWCSDKTSTGKNATMENRSRKEFPLFLTFFARKK